MSTDIDEKVRSCERCLRQKAPIQRAPLVSIETSQPLELVCIYFLTLEASKGGYHNILVITDYFTRYAQAIVTQNQTAKTTAEALFSAYFGNMGFHRNFIVTKVRISRVRL